MHVYSQSDSCCTVIVMGFNVYWAALPSGGRDSLLAGCNCKVREAWKRWQHNSMQKNRVMARVGVVTGILIKTVNGDMETRISTKVYRTHGFTVHYVNVWCVLGHASVK